MYIITGLFNIIHAQYRELDIDLNAIFKEFETDINKLNNPIAKLNIGIFGRYMESVVLNTGNNRTGLEAGFRIPFILTATFFNLYQKSNQVRDLFMELGKYDSITNNITRYSTKQVSLSASALNLKPVAERFHMSERNIQRKLKAEGTSYQHILDALRMELAQKYLRERIPLVEIAFLLGFESQSAFNKFFNKHFHITPSQFR